MNELLTIVAATVLGVAVLMAFAHSRSRYQVLALLMLVRPVLGPSQGLIALAWAFTGLALQQSRDVKRALTSPMGLVVVLFLAGQTLALLHSGERFAVGREMLYVACVLAGLAVHYRAFIDSREALASAAKVLTVPAVVVAASVVAFRISPSAEHIYLSSRVADILIGPEAQALFVDSPNNVRFDSRSGGLLFVNSNRASLFLGLHAMLFLALRYFDVRRRWWIASAVACLVGVAATGSKTGAALAVLALAVGGARTRGGVHWPTLLATAGLALSAFYLLAVPDADGASRTSLAMGYSDSLAERLPMWYASKEFFFDSPLFGLGYDGWFAHWATVARQYGLSPLAPPHNSLIASWSDYGLLAGLAVLASGVISIVLVCRNTTSARRSDAGAAALWASFVPLWAFIHSMGDNTSFYGVPETILAFTAAYVIANGSRAAREPATPEPAPPGLATRRPA